MWEVDPETKSKLLVLQKQPFNAVCADCGSPSPQWASPKFGTFICLDCAGTHRGLGVHISFVRSVMMDSFKVSEVRRMEEGGNSAWREFWDRHPDGGTLGGKGVWEGVNTDRYTGDVAEEYKERLSAKVEGRDFVPLPKRERKPAAIPPTITGSGRSTPYGRSSPAPRSGSPAVQGTSGRKERNEAYFAKMGAENANRPEDLAPNQGGKYGGFGSGFAPEGTGRGTAGQGIPGVDEFQKDPMAALTKGFGWLSSTVGKSAKSVNEGWIQPGVQKFNKLAETDLAAQAKLTAATVAQNMQKGTKGATESFNRFVEGSDSERRSVVEPEKKDFWDSFGGATENTPSMSGTKSTLVGTGKGKSANSIGTSAMKGGGGASDGKEEWGEDGWDRF